MADEYWALGEGDELVEDIRERIGDYYQHLRHTGILYRAVRNWRYYHGIYTGRYSDGLSPGLKEMGAQGEYTFLAVNHFRNLLQHLLTLTTQNRPAFETLAVNSDSRSIEQARLGDQLLEYYLYDQRVEVELKRCVEAALVLVVGYMACTWDEVLGKEIAADVETGQIYNEGDLRLRHYHLFNLAFDARSENWNDKRWVAFKDRVSRWDLQVQYPEIWDEMASWEKDIDDREIELIRSWDHGEEDDYVDRWTFMHEKCPALPYGRTVQFVGGKMLPGTDTYLPYKKIPVLRCVPGEFLLTPFGYSPGFDLQGLQQALNSEMSATLTNHKAFSVQNVWVKTGSNVSVDEITDGLNLIQSYDKPEPLSLLATSQEVFVLMDKLMEHMEYLSGVNSVARGQPEASLKSGSALALIDSKAVQFNSALQNSYYMLLEDVGTTMLRTLSDFASRERVVAIQGIRNGLVSQRAFTGDNLVQIDRVRVLAGNYLSRTLPGRVEIAKELLASQLIKTPEEFFSIMDSGRHQDIYEFERAQINVIKEENEQLLSGQPARALMTDNHILHVREHTAVLNTTQLRQLPGVTDAVLAHVMEHVHMFLQPGTELLQAFLGGASPGSMGPLPTNGRSPPGVQGRQAMGVEPGGAPAMPRMPKEPNTNGAER